MSPRRNYYPRDWISQVGATLAVVVIVAAFVGFLYGIAG